MLTPEGTKLGYSRMWAAMKIRPEKKAAADKAAKVIAKYRARYEYVEKCTGVPWWFIGCLHMRESSCNFTTFLGNGEPLNRVTKLVPKGMGPFPTWEAGAIAALTHEKLHLVKVWDIPTGLFYFEAFNGPGYVSKGINSPYVWAFSNLYTSGKFIADGEFSPSTTDTQPGCAVLLVSLILQGLIPALAEKVITMATNTVAPIVKPSAVPSAGVTVGGGQNLATHLIVFVGAILGAMGLSQVHSMYDALTSSGLIGGLAVSGLAMMISHFNVNGSNQNTIDLIDKIVTSLTPAATAPMTLMDTHEDHAAA